MRTDTKTKDIIVKWYLQLNFNPKFDDEFYFALDNIYVDSEATVEAYPKDDEDGQKNLLHYLYFCEKLEKRYENEGIPRCVFLDTVADIVSWCESWSEIKGKLYLGELPWLSLIFTMQLFKLGRLQFRATRAKEDVPESDIKSGDGIIEIHIPRRGPLDYFECLSSLEMAKSFYSEHYPDFRYNYFTCHSWLLDQTLTDMLGGSSNVLRFQTLFNIVRNDISDAILTYVFRWKITRDEIFDHLPCRTSFAAKVRDAVLSGRTFYAGLGIIKK